MVYRAWLAAGLAAVVAVTIVTAGVAAQSQNPGKVAICHQTTKGFVKIVVSKSAIDAHKRHDGDIVFMDENGTCPPGTSNPPGASNPNKVAICHKTGSKKKGFVKFVKITVSKSAIEAHTRHDGDVVLMDENASCPTVAAAQSGVRG